MAALIHERIQERAELKAEALKILEATDRTPDQEARLDVIETRIAALDKDIARLSKLQDDERQQGTPPAARQSSSGVKTSGAWVESEPGDAVAAGPTPVVYHGLPGMEAQAGLRYAFGQQLSDVFRATMRHEYTENLRTLQAAAQGAGEKVGADGGFLVQTDVVAGLLREVFTGGAVLARVRQINLGENSNGVTLRAVDETSRATGSRWGGVQAYWVDEGTAATAKKPKFRKVELKLNKLAALGYATDELLADGVAMGDIMFQAFSEEIRFLVEDAIINGTGAGQPQGLLNAAATVSVTRTTASTVKLADISNMWARMHARAKANAAWLINTDVNPQLDQLHYVVGTDGVILPGQAVTYTPEGARMIKGRPVIETEYNATMGTVGDILLVDLTQYLFIQKLLQTASSMHVAFTTDEMAFRVTWRVDGKPAWVAALTPFKGSNTQSPYISLAT